MEIELKLDHEDQAFLDKLPLSGEKADKEKCYSVNFEKTIGPDELESGRWLQVSKSVYGLGILGRLNIPIADIGDFFFFFPYNTHTMHCHRRRARIHGLQIVR